MQGDYLRRSLRLPRHPSLLNPLIYLKPGPLCGMPGQLRKPFFQSIRPPSIYPVPLDPGELWVGRAGLGTGQVTMAETVVCVNEGAGAVSSGAMLQSAAKRDGEGSLS